MAEVHPIAEGSDEALRILRHSTSHVMAAAVGRLFPAVKFAIGPAVEDGFYYDFDIPQTLSSEDLASIETEMKNIVSSGPAFERTEVDRGEALERMRSAGQDYKTELIEGMGVETVTFYTLGDFTDLCRGPHLPDTGRVKHFKLLNVAGAYWRGDERNKMLQRIYGTAFFSREELETHLKNLEETKKRDHRKLGVALDFYHIDDEVGAGLVLWHPKGALVRKIIEDFWREEHLKAGYELVATPHLARYALWEKSGHTDFFSQNMYPPVELENERYLVKPMNCPFHLLIYKSRVRSYRDLPIRWAELGTVYRYEKSGVLHGLTRVRGFTQDDAHLIFLQDQMDDEIERVLRFCVYILGAFGFTDYGVYLSTRPSECIGAAEVWQTATDALRGGLERVGLDFQVEEGAGAFYGPKIDIKIKDALGRQWQCSTIQLDFNEPERFDITYAGADGRRHRPVMIHRALLGSLERFFAVLVEHYGGLFPLWLAPVQVRVLPLTDRQSEYAKKIHRQLLDHGIRPECDLGSEKVGHKIRNATLEKVPYMLVVGPREVQALTVSVRHCRRGDLGTQKPDEFIGRIRTEIEEKTGETR